MDDSLKIYWKLFFQKRSNSQILREFHNPIRAFEGELINGAIVDIGCGQSSFLLDYASSDRELIAIDEEQFQLDLLKKRVSEESSAKIQNWKFYKQKFPNKDIPSRVYSLIILSNLLHFFTLDKCKEIGNLIGKKISKGALVYVCVHSDKYYKNNPEDSNNNEYFKHYFTTSDLEAVFPDTQFERTYFATVDRIDSKSEEELIEEWLDMCLTAEGINDPEECKAAKEEYLQNNRYSDLVAIFRKR